MYRHKQFKAYISINKETIKLKLNNEKAVYAYARPYYFNENKQKTSSTSECTK